ncbi:MAG: OmpA family protein, partial [Mucinivorans sp.]
NASFTGALRTRSNQQIPYSVSFPYEPWMADLSLRLERQVVRCCTEGTPSSIAILTSKPVRYDVVLEPIVPVVVLEPSPTQQLDIELPCLSVMSDYHAMKDNFDALRAEGALIVYFKQGGGMVDPNFAQNQKSLDQIKKILSLISSDPRAKLGKIVIAGAASPEGGVPNNIALAQKRANALKNYLGDSISSQTNLFEVVNVGEDWTGLRQMVAASNMEYKDLVLKTIDQYTVKQGREVELMKLKWGRPYNYMMEHFFPKLRSAGYIRLFYESKPSAQYEATVSAVESYNNRAYTDVLTRLENVSPTALTQMMCGACHMMLGHYDQAELTLQEAITLGSPDAAKLLEQLHKLQRIHK